MLVHCFKFKLSIATEYTIFANILWVICEHFLCHFVSDLWTLRMSFVSDLWALFMSFCEWFVNTLYVICEWFVSTLDVILWVICEHFGCHFVSDFRQEINE